MHGERPGYVYVLLFKLNFFTRVWEILFNVFNDCSSYRKGKDTDHWNTYDYLFPKESNDWHENDTAVKWS